MKIQYIFAPDDYEAYLNYHLNESLKMQGHFLLQSPLTTFYLLAIIVGVSVLYRSPWPAVIGLAVVPLFFFINRCYRDTLARREIDAQVEQGKKERIYGPKSVAVSNGQITVQSEGYTNTLEVSLIEKVVQTETHLFLYTTKTAAHIIPLNVLSHNELDDLLQALNEDGPPLEALSPSSTAIREFACLSRKSGPDDRFWHL